MNQQLAHIFDESACLNKKQMRDYVSGVMTKEECHAAEVHLVSCPFCSEAVEGLMMNRDEAVQTLAALNPNFIREHFHEIMPEIHLNSVALSASSTVTMPARKKQKVHYLWKVSSIAAGLLILFGSLWYLNKEKNDLNRQLSVAAPGKTISSPENNSSGHLPAAAQGEAKEQQNIQPQTGGHDKPGRPSYEEQSAPVTASDTYGVTAEETVTPAEASRQQPPAKDADPDAYRNFANNQLGRDAYVNNYNTRKQNSAPVFRSKAGDSVSPSEMKKLPARSVPDGVNNSGIAEAAHPHETETVASGNAAGKKEEISYNEDVPVYEKSRTKAVKTAAAAESLPGKAEDNMTAGKRNFKERNYSAALKYFAAEAKSRERPRRHEALIMSAQCYRALGKHESAKKVLQRVIDEGGSQKRTARQMLREMEKAERSAQQ